LRPPSIAAAKKSRNGAEPAQKTRDENGERGLAGSAQRQIADADYGTAQAFRAHISSRIKGIARADDAPE
jgi:hypothetical protein